MSKLPNAPEIEPLSDVAWRRIERRVFDELDRMSWAQDGRPAAAEPRFRGWRPAWPMAMTAGLAAAALLLFLLRGSDPDGDRPWQRVTTGESPVQITLNRAILDVAPFSELEVWDGGGRGVQVALKKGGIHCAVTPNPALSPFTVAAGDVRVEVIGTRFSVTRTGQTARVVVEDGTVHVFYDDKEEAVLGAGEAWPHADEQATSAAIPGADATREGGEVSEELAVQAERAGASRPAEVSQDAWAKAQYEKAALLEAAQPERALAIYRRVARGSGPWAANALFAQGRLELERGHLETALATLRDYLQRYPRGLNASDAQELIRSARQGR